MVRCIFLFLAFLLVSMACPPAACSQHDLAVWNEFIQLVRNHALTLDRIRPHEQMGDAMKPVLLGFTDSLRAQASAEDWTSKPEIITTGDRIQFIIPWSSRGGKTRYCFSFVTEGPQWYFQHLETIFIRLDKLPALPVSEFPDVSEQQKAWAREEIYWSFLVMNVYLPVARENGREYALNLLKDGGGYFVGAKTWVPFVSPQKAFILYLCWEQANLRGNPTTLLRLGEHDAVVTVQTHFFALYFAASHLKPIISLDDYKRIFETIWLNRASSAGWNVEFQYAGDYTVTLHFTRDI